MKTTEVSTITLTAGSTNYSDAHKIEGEKCGVYIKITDLDTTTIDLTFLEGNNLDILSYGNKNKDLDLTKPLTYTLNNGNYFFSLNEIYGNFIGFKFDPKTNSAGTIIYSISKIED